MWLNVCFSGLSMTTGISSVSTLSTFIGLPVSMCGYGNHQKVSKETRESYETGRHLHISVSCVQNKCV